MVFNKGCTMQLMQLILLIIIFNSAIFGQQTIIVGPRLSPLPDKVAGVQQVKISLNGKWNFEVQGSNDKQIIDVPGEWEMQGFSLKEGQTAIYSYEPIIPEDWRGKQVYVRFDGVSSHAIIKFNGVKIGEHEGSFVPFEVRLNSAVKEGKNLLQVEVQALTISDILACTSQYAVHTVGGILRKVTMFVLPQTNIASLNVATIFDQKYSSATLKINTTIDCGISATNNIKINYSLLDTLGKVVAVKAFSINKNNFSSQQEIQITKPKHWDPEHPYLYQLTATLLQDGKLLQTNIQRVGFRQVQVNGNRLLVNGKPIKLHGVNRHSVYPLTGRSIPESLDRKDAELFRAANCNYIRTSHYPPSQEFLDAADELGLFVESEASLTWIQHNASPIWLTWNYLDEKFLPYMIRANIENIAAGRNHPCVIIWSLGNESRWSPLWAKVLAVVKKLDSSRPTSFHDQCWGGYNNAGSKADIAVYHYPGTNAGSACDTMKRPVLMGEYAHISCYNRRELLTDPGVRISYGQPLAQLYDSLYYHDACLGGAIWSGIDDIFHLPDGRIVGYGPWGPIDGWRRPKPEYWGIKKAYSPVKVLATNWATLSKGYIELTVENRYDFTSLKEVKIFAAIDGIAQNVSADINARSKGIIRVPSNKNVKSLYISFTDPRGFMADNEKFEQISKEEILSKKVSVSYTEDDKIITVQQGYVTYKISKKNGIIIDAIVNGKHLLGQGPVLCIVPMNSDDGGKPNVAGETYQNDIFPLKNYPLYTLYATNLIVGKQDIDGILITMNVSYLDAKGKQSYLFGTNGIVVTRYEVTYQGIDTLPYQYGLLMQLPKKMDKLSWKRKGDFTTYPANDIGRNEGEAMLNAIPLNAVEPWRVVLNIDWKDDANALGSNDFRSTKRYIKEASLEDNSRSQITILSDATQSSRSWLQDEQVQWLIADYCNNGSEPYYGSPHTSGQINIKNTVLKGGVAWQIK